MSREYRLYFSFRSPYSWISVDRLRKARPDLAQLVRMIPYWDPDPITEKALADLGAEFHYVQMSKAKHLYILQDTKRLTTRLGIRMAWPIDIDPWWERPHLAWLRAAHDGDEQRLYDAVTAARWERGENICEPDVLRRACDAAGLDGDRLVAAADDPEIRAEAARCLELAYYDDVFGIPYLKLGRHRFWGLDRVDEAIGVLGGPVAPAVAPAESAESPESPEPAKPTESIESTEPPGSLEQMVAVGASWDTDTAGGCG